MKQFDVLVIGAGSGGLVAAETAAKLGASVALLEKSDKLGGDCLHYGCVPSKSLIHTARSVWSANHQPFAPVNNASVEFSAVSSHITNAIGHIQHSHDNDERYQAMGIEVLHGEIAFTDSHTVTCGDQTLHGKKIIVATGSSGFIPPITGLDSVDYLTNETIFSLNSLPESLVVIGGGPIGCELGQAFAMLGSKVTIIQGSDRLLPREEPEASTALHSSLESMNATILTNASATAVTKQDEMATVRVEIKDKDPLDVIASHILVATGRRSNLPQGLDSADIKTNERGIVVDKKLRTNQKHIYAVGDCNGGLQFTHSAAAQAVLAVQHALYGFSADNPDVLDTPWTTFTTPEIAHIGETKASLASAGTTHRVLETAYADIDKAVTGSEDGSIEILVNNSGKILGATVYGTGAGELINYIAYIKQHGTIQDIGGVVQAYPTISFALKQLAGEFALTRANTGLRGIIVRHIRKLRLR